MHFLGQKRKTATTNYSCQSIKPVFKVLGIKDFVGKGHFVGKKVHKINEKSLKKRQIELKNVAPVLSTYIRAVRPQLLFSLGTFDSFLAGLDRNWVESALPIQAHKPV